MNAIQRRDTRLGNGRLVRALGYALPIIVCPFRGCVEPAIDLDPLGPAGAVEFAGYDDRPWATVVRENVRDGLVDYDHLQNHREPLDAYLRRIAAVGPETTPDLFPTPNARLCYYINVHNAAVLAGVLHADIPRYIHDPLSGRLDHRFRLRVDGRLRRIHEIARLALLEAHDDARVLFALCDGSKSAPPLYDQPFRPRGLELTLHRLAEQAMENPRIIAVDHAAQVLRISTLLGTHRDRFIEFYKRSTGAAEATMLNVAMYFANHVRRQWLNTAVGYPERMMPADRLLNRWSPSAGS